MFISEFFNNYDVIYVIIFKYEFFFLLFFYFRLLLEFVYFTYVPVLSL